jgi:hypothetical protein
MQYQQKYTPKAQLPRPLLSYTRDLSVGFCPSHVNRSLQNVHNLHVLAADLPAVSDAWRFRNALQLINHNGGTMDFANLHLKDWFKPFNTGLTSNHV